MTRWSNETTYKFVSAYVERECLWNINSPLYKHRAAKDAAIYEIENLMGIEGFNKKEIKQKIKNIRSTYCQELRKMKESESSAIAAELVYVPKVKWFGILDECLKTLKPESIEDDSNLTKSNITDENIEDEINFLDAEIEGTLIRTNSRETKPTRRRKKQKTPDNQTVPPMSNEITVSANPLPLENEFDVFGKHVALQLKSLPLLLALDAQEHIQLYLNRTRREYIVQNSAEQLATGISIEIPMCSTQD